MDKRYVGLLTVVAAMACLAVIGAVGGTYLANRDETRSAGSTEAPRAPAGSAAGRSDVPAPSGSAGQSGPSRPSGPGKSSPSAGPTRSTGPSTQERDRTYPIDRIFYDQALMTVTLVSATVANGSMRLNFRYHNGSLIAWPLTCPSVAVDRTSSQITLADGRTVRPESTWCAMTRPGQSFTVAPGADLSTWATFPVVPEPGSSFALSWYDFTEVENLQLR